MAVDGIARGDTAQTAQTAQGVHCCIACANVGTDWGPEEGADAQLASSSALINAVSNDTARVERLKHVFAMKFILSRVYNRRCGITICTRSNNMFWVFLQVFMAFGIGIFIVWWSLPRKKKTTKPPLPTSDAKD